MQNNSNAKLSLNSLRVKIQEMGGFLSAMVMPNIGVFIAWGTISSLFYSYGLAPQCPIKWPCSTFIKIFNARFNWLCGRF